MSWFSLPPEAEERKYVCVCARVCGQGGGLEGWGSRLSAQGSMGRAEGKADQQ